MGLQSNLRTEAAEKTDGFLTSDAVSQLTYTRAVINEAIRLLSPGIIVRMVMKPTPVKNYVV